MSRQSFDENLTEWRHLAKSRYSESIQKSEGVSPYVPKELPGYFVDRYAFRLFLHTVSPETKAPTEIPDFDISAPCKIWRSELQERFIGVPSLGICTPDLSETIAYSKFCDDLFKAWREHLASYGIDCGKLCVPPFGKTWEEYFRHSAHYPRQPAIRGPIYFGDLCRKHRALIVANHGTQSVMDFFIFMQQVHEESHLLQTGEPVLCELVHSWLWCDFLNSQDLWKFQLNSETGKCCNVESQWLKRIHLKRNEVAELFLDTKTGIDRVFRSAVAYETFCFAAWQFDSKEIRYAKYLEIVTDHFCGRPSACTCASVA